ncbi:hypothetical protein P886_2825 [Alteromonadaceae bacterium 2753L.S.0a.02]|nr:hypothetical protein P886_2825 [Alteromonadaceae bacterium 2753L.S.0a.02]
MSSVNIIVTIVVLLAILVCYAFVSQTLRQKREQRLRVTAALKSRLRNFKFMINGFPKGFLPRELTLLVQRSLIDVCEQLSKLEPREPSHLQDLQAVTQQLQETQRQARPSDPVVLENPQQIKEVKMCLEELHRFIFQLERKGTVSHTHAEGYRSQIKQMVLQLTVDNYSLLGRQAQQSDKLKLAIHYFDLCVKLMLREGRPGQFDTRIQQQKLAIEQLRARLAELESTKPASAEEIAEQEQIAEEWDKFGSDEEVWKKKHAYD